MCIRDRVVDGWQSSAVGGGVSETFCRQASRLQHSASGHGPITIQPLPHSHTRVQRLHHTGEAPHGDVAPVSYTHLDVYKRQEHALIQKLEGSAHFDDLAHIVFDQALLAEGGLPADPAAYVRRVNALLV